MSSPRRSSACPDAPRGAWQPEPGHLLTGTTGRHAPSGYTWLQAVCWAARNPAARPAEHGPRFGQTTVRLARLLADLTPCRPTVAYLARHLKASRRTVQYHLGLLRTAGLLVWRTVGTRLPGQGGRARRVASEYERVIPGAFDHALGLRTAGQGLQRRVTGIAAQGRALIAELGQEAAQRRHKPRRARTGCTPNRGGTTTDLSFPSDVASKTPSTAGADKNATRKQTKRRTVLGNPVTARMMADGNALAHAAYRRLPWVRAASHRQLRWAVNDLTARGWTQERALVWLAETGAATGADGAWIPQQPHALIASALRAEAAQAAEQRVRDAEADHAEQRAAWAAFETAPAAAPRRTAGPDAVPEPLPELDREELAVWRREIVGAWLHHGDTSMFRALAEHLAPEQAESLMGSALYHRLTHALEVSR